MATTLHSTSPKLAPENNLSKNMDSLLNFSFGSNSLDDCLRKNELDLESMILNGFKESAFSCNEEFYVRELSNKSVCSYSPGPSLHRLKSTRNPIVTKSLSGLENLEESFASCSDQSSTEYINVSMPELISGHSCEDTCSCYCNVKLKRINRCRDVLLKVKMTKIKDGYCEKDDQFACHDTSQNLTVAKPVSSHQQESLSSPQTALPTTFSSLFSPQKTQSPSCMTLEQSKRPSHLCYSHSCPTLNASRKFLSEISNSSVVVCGDGGYQNVDEKGSRRKFMSEWDELYVLRRIQSEISVIQLKQKVILQDYYRKKWAKLEEKKLLQRNSFRGGDVKMKLTRVDYELLKLGEKFRSETEAIKKLLNEEHKKMSLLYSKHSNSSKESTDAANQLSFSSSDQSAVTEEIMLSSFKKCHGTNVIDIQNSLMNDVSMSSSSCSKYDNDVEDDVFHTSSTSATSKTLKIRNLVTCEEAIRDDSNINGSAPDVPEIKYRCTQSSRVRLLNRPLTRYLPIKGEEANFDLKHFIEQAGHGLDLCKEVKVTMHEARGFLKKLGRRFSLWKSRWFVFDRKNRQLRYYGNQSEVNPKGRISFQSIEDVYIDGKMLKCASSKPTFCLKTVRQTYILMAPSTGARQIWIDVLVTGAEAYQDYFL